MRVTLLFHMYLAVEIIIIMTEGRIQNDGDDDDAEEMLLIIFSERAIQRSRNIITLMSSTSNEMRGEMIFVQVSELTLKRKKRERRESGCGIGFWKMKEPNEMCVVKFAQEGERGERDSETRRRRRMCLY